MERAAEGKGMVHSETMDGWRLEEIIANIKLLTSNSILIHNSFRVTLFPYMEGFSRDPKNVTHRHFHQVERDSIEACLNFGQRFRRPLRPTPKTGPGAISPVANPAHLSPARGLRTASHGSKLRQRGTRAHFTPQHWLLCYLGLYLTEFEFEVHPAVPRMVMAW